MIEGVLGEFELEGIETTGIPSEVDEEEAEEVHETVEEKVLTGHDVDKSEGVVLEKDAPGVPPEVEEAKEVHLEVEETGKEHPSTPINNNIQPFGPLSS